MAKFVVGDRITDYGDDEGTVVLVAVNGNYFVKWDWLATMEPIEYYSHNIDSLEHRLLGTPVDLCTQLLRRLAAEHIYIPNDEQFREIYNEVHGK